MSAWARIFTGEIYLSCVFGKYQGTHLSHFAQPKYLLRHSSNVSPTRVGIFSCIVVTCNLAFIYNYDVSLFARLSLVATLSSKYLEHYI